MPSLPLSLPSDPSCAFCRIARGETKATELYRDEWALAFRDIRPVAPIHILIIPLRHVASVQDLTETDAGLLDRMARIAGHLAEAEQVSASGYRLVINSGGDAGQSVFHLHMHLLAGRRMLWPPG